MQTQSNLLICQSEISFLYLSKTWLQHTKHTVVKKEKAIGMHALDFFAIIEYSEI